MKLYHGSKYDGEKIESRQAAKAEDLVGVPEEELQNGIYMSPDYGFAFSMGARPRGQTAVGNDDKTISFENPELFNPDENVFLYTFDSDKIPAENLECIDNLHYIVKEKNKLTPVTKETLKAGELFKYYKLVDWKENKEIVSEQKIKLR